MSNTNAVVQLPVAVKETSVRRPRDAGRDGVAERRDSDFRQLVSKLAHARPRAGRDDTSPAEAVPSPEGNRSTEGGWRRRGADWAGEKTPAIEPDTTTTGQDWAPAQQDSDIAQLLTAASDPALLAQLLAAGGMQGDTLGQAAAMVARFAAGTATEDDVALLRNVLSVTDGGEGPAQPDAAMLASLVKSISQGEARRSGIPTGETVGKVAVLGREVHLAPVSALDNLAAAMAAGGDLEFGVGAQPGTDTPASAVRDETTVGAKLDIHLANLRGAVTGAPSARFSADRNPSGGLAENFQQALESSESTADDGLATGAEQVATTGVRADTLLRPGSPMGVAQQIANRVATEAGTLLSQTSRPETPSFGLAQHSGSPVKVLYIQLQPVDLGTVTIRMSLKDQALQLDLEVGRGETRHLIQREQDALSALLRSAGYVIDGLDVRMAGPNGAHPPPADQQASMQMHGGGQSRGSQPEGRSPGAGSQDGRGGTGFGSGRKGEDEQTGHTSRRGGLYI